MNLQREIDQAPEGGIVEVPPGTHSGGLIVTKSITLRGENSKRSFINARGRAACLLINAPNVRVVVSQIALLNGVSDVGGGIAFRVGESLVVDACTIEGCSSMLHGGGGLLLGGKSAKLLRTRIVNCQGLQGGGVLVDEECEAELVACVLCLNAAAHGGALRIKEAAKVRLIHCTIANNQVVGKTPIGDEIAIGGTSTRMPELLMVNSIVAHDEPSAPTIAVVGEYAGKVDIRSSLLPPSEKAHWSGQKVIFGTPLFFPAGVHRYVPAAGSPATGRGDPTSTPQGLIDILGKPLADGDSADLGAYAAR